MRHYVNVDDDRFVVFEELTEPRYCPTCGTSRSVTLKKHIMLIQGDRFADEASWHVLRDENVERLPWLFDDANQAAYEFAGVGEGHADKR